ncbi:MAG TPA: isoleucine--tRNA ligase [bacterium]|nr:isoleucine--tRNA ligase [bacterium]
MSESPKNNKNDYRSTLNLPQTAFPMKADLVKKEPETLKRWQESGLYAALLKKNASGKRFVLHDGPPYANGSIHFGHILNKILKDVIVRYKALRGFESPYVPGWDCHGLPIEHQVDKDLGAKKKGMSQLEIRKACREYAQKFVNLQREDFRRLGVMGDWENPYLTMNYAYEATIAREFGRFVKEGNVYKALRPVLWCANDRTALADAETEYDEKESPSIYVRFWLVDPEKLSPQLRDKKVSIVIWTTTPWTLPANLAVALHENYDYVVVPVKDEFAIVAKQLLGDFSKAVGLEEEPEALVRFSGKKLENELVKHPFLPRTSRVVISDHVSMDTGTGCVHIAPGHGEDDYAVGLKYGLPILSPVDHAGRFTEEAGVPEWVGQKVFDANPAVIQRLKDQGALVLESKIRHQYPHCWRCKNPLLFRATEQYFLSLEKNALRAKALDAIRRTNWVPAWGRERIYGMIERRGDWCLSRQRSWGVPIVAFRCADCSEILLDADVIDEVADLFEKDGSDIWYESPESCLPPDKKCAKCGSVKWLKENHILDVWFDSGVSFAAVLEQRKDLKYPADLYLEGSDQHRGWFHSSLLASIGTRGRAPYETVLTHGFVVDSQGKKYSKSAGNYVPPDKVLKENGAEILRLWVAAEDYRNDIRVSNEILTRLVEAYRKIRNTGRYLLGNLFDFDPATSFQDVELREIDKWALHHLQKLVQRAEDAYEGYNFHVIFHELNRYCTVDLSAFYLDILKDRLYTSGKKDPARRGAQRVLFEIAATLARIMAPILSFTSEEIWDHLPAVPNKATSVHLTGFPAADPAWVNEALAERWENFQAVRAEVLKVLEKARQAKTIGTSLEAKVILTATDEPEALLRSFENDLPDLLQASQVVWGTALSSNATRSEAFPTLFIEVVKADGAKCERCWRFSTRVGEFSDHPTVCERCHDVLLHG